MSFPARPFDCPTCGQVHPLGCRAHKRDGSACLKVAGKGQNVCMSHGGAKKAARANARRRLARAQAESEARRIVNLGYANPNEPFDAIERLITLCRLKQAEIDWLRRQVISIDQDALVWGMTEQKVGGEDSGVTYSAAQNVWWQLLREAEAVYATWLAVLIKANVDERRLYVAESVGAAVVGVMRAVQGDALQALLAAGVSEEIALVFRLAFDTALRTHMLSLRSEPQRLSSGKGA